MGEQRGPVLRSKIWHPLLLRQKRDKRVSLAVRPSNVGNLAPAYTIHTISVRIREAEDEQHPYTLWLFGWVVKCAISCDSCSCRLLRRPKKL